MIRFEIFDKINQLEELMFRGYKLWIFRGYVAVNKRGAEKIIDDIYATLPVDVLNARKYLKEHSAEISESKETSIYDVLKDIEILLDKGSFLPELSIVDKEKFEQLEEKLKNSVPEAINKALKK